jgi:uncharacterized tellurite resistance protein B-like protein
MTRSHRLSFLKVLAAVAWADGVVEEDERNRIKVLFNGFELDPADRKEVDELLERPVTFDRAVELTKEFAGALAPAGARRKLLSEIEAMLGADERRSPEERELLEHVRSILSSHTVVDGILDKMRGLFSRTLFARRADAPSTGALTDFARNSALRRVADLFRERGWSLPEDLAAWNRATLLGVLLARIAHLDEGWDHGERDVVDRVLAERLDMDEPLREILLAVIDEERERDTDVQRICAEYCRISDMKDRLEVLDALFTIASADAVVTKNEVEQIRRIADCLWISNPEYLAVRDRHRDRIEP